MPRHGCLPYGLYLVTPESDDDDALASYVEAALAGMPAVLQYRSKLASPGTRLAQAVRLGTLCRSAGVPFIINDDIALACQVDADGVHVGKADGDLAAVRAQIGGGRLLGVSCYNEWWRAEAAVSAGADYIAFGAMFPSPTKPDTVRAAPALLTRARAELPVSVVAIGGITLDTAPALIAAGATQLAVISDVFSAPDVTARAAAFAALYANPDHEQGEIR